MARRRVAHRRIKEHRRHETHAQKEKDSFVDEGGITAISPDGSVVEHTELPDLLVTNICFVGTEPRAYCTMSGTGQLVEIDWPRPGLELAYSA